MTALTGPTTFIYTKTEDKFKKMPTTHQINLIQKDDFENSPLGKFLHWSITVGRWIVVFTDFIVILAFFSRFYFDTKLANLHDSIKQGQAIIEATADFEKTFLSLQKKIDQVKLILGDKFNSDDRVEFINGILPADVSLTAFTLTSNGLNLTGSALSESGISQFMKNLLSAKQIEKVNISGLTIGEKEEQKVISFTLSANWKKL